MKPIFLFLNITCYLLPFSTFPQCISTFPYSEGFELNDGGWTSTGLNNDWTWGTPSKAVITGAGGGSKCWIPGGLTASFYNFSEQAYVVSPCFNFSSITNPFISFKIFWEVERKYDGGNLQYSTDTGNTWTNVGAYGDAVDCMNSNWYNYSAIVYLNSPLWIPVRDGWSGNVQPTAGSCQGGFGSGTWVTAKHCMPYLAGIPSVLFRFTLGAGTQCNSYDGLAFDDILIENAPANVPSFTSSCSGTTISFSGAGTPCPTSFSWNFGDGNSSTQQNPSHTYSSPGVYTVSLTTNGPCNPSGTISQPIKILSANISSSTNVSCNGGNDGSATVTTINGISPYSYSWSNGQASQTSTGLSIGNYSVTVTDSSGCFAVAFVTINQPSVITSTTSSTLAGCGLSNGSATVTASGGNSPYTYLWEANANNQTTQTATGIAAGIYSVTVTDSTNCAHITTVTVGNTGAPTVTTSFADPSCNNGNNGSASVTANGGTSPYTYLWSNGATQSQISNLTSQTYFITVTDANGCEAIISATLNNPSPITVSVDGIDTICKSDSTILVANGGNAYLWNMGDTTQTITVNPMAETTYFVTITTVCGDMTDSIKINIRPAVIAFAGNDATIILGNSIQLTATGGSLYQWSTGANTNTITVSPTENTSYEVTVTDAAGCSDVASVNIAVNEPEKYYISVPNIFSPNDDQKNDFIFVHGSGIKEFRLVIYDRWGEKVFTTKEKTIGWDGTYRGKPLNSGVFVYFLEATFNDASVFKEKGNITLLR